GPPRAVGSSARYASSTCSVPTPGSYYRGGADDYYAAQGEGEHRAWHACGKSAEAPAATFAPYRPRGRSCVPGTVLRAVAREFGIARSPDVGHPFPRCPRGGVSGQLLLVPPR
ncbi:MAG TPA: hypothetical protein VIV60_24945, partial [Polyangiaceae bacterium]